MKHKPYRKYLILAVGVLALLVAGFFGYKWWQARQNSPEALAAKADAEKQKILANLAKQMILPEGDPVLFKVSNENVMKSQQAFFKDTKNDDVLLVFQQSGKAILYRPEGNLIVNVGPVNFDSQAKSPSTQTGEVTKPATDTKTSNTKK